MKKLILIPAFVFLVGYAYAQTEEKRDPQRPTNTEVNENVEKGQEISNMGTTLEGGKDKGVSISGAARRSTLNRERASRRAENSETGRERAAIGAESAERSRATSNQVRPTTQTRPEVPAAARPNITVPQSRPNAPVVRPNRPVPTRPKPPTVRPGG
jgi:hypothetical protein